MSSDSNNKSNVVQFKKKSLKEKHRGKTLCKNGFHKWQINQKKQFDVKSGKLITLSVCKRCGARKTENK